MKLKSDGQSLVEVVASLALAIVIVGALVNMVVSSLRSSQFAKNTAQATKYAQEAVEWIRSERDRATSWDEFVNSRSDKVWCLPSVVSWPSSVGNCGSTNLFKISDTIFNREAEIESIDNNGDGRADLVLVTVTVKWLDQTGEHKSTLTTKFSDRSKWD